MIPKVRGFLRSDSRIPVYRNGKDQPPTMKQLESTVDREANDNITLSGSALSGDVAVGAALDHEGGLAISVMQRGERVLLVTIPGLAAYEAGMPAKIDVAKLRHSLTVR
jgi:hypothetical protein